MTPESTDHDLLREFAHDGAQPAFAELVRRHLDLVYSAARRQIRAPELAEEIAQSVFTDLARNVAKISADQPLAAWLHLVTRRTAVDFIRRESRRRARETQAMEMETMNEPSSDWRAVEPLLDEAVASLNEGDRAAILLRYFENKSLRDIGAVLGTTDDAAQKRISRAVEQLRAFFLHRGIAVTAAGLASDLSAHAIVTAPAGLGAAISASSFVTAATATTAVLETSRFIAMTTLQKSAVALAAALFVGVGAYQAVTIRAQRAELSRLDARAVALQTTVDRLAADQAAEARRLATAESQIDARLAQARAQPAPVDPAVERQLRAWLANRDRLRQLIASRPDLAIPELRLLSAQDWIDFASELIANVDFENETVRRQATAFLRRRAESVMIKQLQRALNAYVQTTAGMLPDTLEQLLPYFDPPATPDLLMRYELLHNGKVADVPAAERDSRIIATRMVVDRENDRIWEVGPRGFSSKPAQPARRPGAAP